MAKLDPSLLAHVLKNVRFKTTDELIQLMNELEVSLMELMRSKPGITREQIENLPDEVLKEKIRQEYLTKEDFNDFSISSEKVDRLFGTASSVCQQCGNEQTFCSCVNHSSGNTDEATRLKHEIIAGVALADDIRDALQNRIITEEDLLALHLSHELIDKIRNYHEVTCYFPDIIELPALRNNATDVYFLGMPGSGKSTMLASLMSYGDRHRLYKRNTINRHGTEYLNDLIMGFDQGYLPKSTQLKFVNYIAVDFRHSEKENVYQQLNFLDMAGEQFKSVAEKGVHNFRAYQEYFKNDNPKCLIFMLDYFDKRIARQDLLRQNINLQQVLAVLEDFGILERTEFVYLVVTKADLFPTEDKTQFVKDYVERDYGNFFMTCKEYKNKYGFKLKYFPYSIGPTVFSYILKESNPLDNPFLDYYPKLLSDQILNDATYIKPKGRWF